ncbi:glycosyltransferase family 39 protein [Haloarcula onubensis]|uniref:Glycosyltransferase family 39 protein n=1 Tax=Haloarcula onubensis TaxID=2950539 RepID=A0ABU2FPD6_9EURY|nr:glycosyltransferase family 39 protein [Halomicroarcula sp. S3CR25-11]MDS0282274.1 glycosyltransferase family 39 protein [Halomicroarcula sp. S3CR25-11]
MDRTSKQALSVFLLAFSVRVVGAVVTTVTTLNPDSRADAVRFGNGAEAIARGLPTGQPFRYTADAVELYQVLNPIAGSDTILTWGIFISPFWLLPGPSGLYARLGNGLLGAIAIYHVYRIGRYYYSHQAGVLAALPMILYPSFVAVQTTLLRDVFVFFGIVTAARLLVLPPKRLNRWLSYGLAYAMLHLALIHRQLNVVLYVGAITAGIATYVIVSRDLYKETIGLGALSGPVVYVLSLPLIRSGITRLARIRRLRASGRAVYLPNVIPQTLPELISFSWIGAAYFLYAPFPWMVRTAPDLIVSLEGISTLAFTICAVWGVRSMGRKDVPVTVGLVVGLVLAVVFYGVGTVNYGTGQRHRQMVLWVIFLFGGIGITEHVKLVWPFPQRRSPPEGTATSDSSQTE